ncbi:MAG: hypothetical protein ACI379_15905 [Nocardioides sp.]|uniref:hypothetical protein n=1 Tax=Nocardioides sp. TaxID=35761 RepID=UPI003F11BC2C
MTGPVLTTPPGWRLLFTATALFFTAGLVWNVQRMVAGTFEWTTTYVIGIPLLVVIVLGGVVGAAAAWTSRVWVDGAGVLHQRTLRADVTRVLAPPTTVRFVQTLPARGSTLMGTWTLHVVAPGEPVLKISTPYVGDISDLARLLQPALAAHPELAADEVSRQAIEEPASLRSPTGL